jgi:Caenorhabditis protein of unknown function, DUF268
MSPLKRLKRICRFYRDMAAFTKAGGVITDTYPILRDFGKQAGTATGHYFHQDLLVATQIKQANPNRHIDVGSSIEGFVAHVASFREIEVLDIRPLQIAGHSQIRFVQSALMRLDQSLIGSCDSLSCLHALEHFGLGRYGDSIDPNGHLKGFYNLSQILRSGGTLYISFPIGKPAVHFNAHRIFHLEEILDWSKDLFQLIRFDFVDDAGNLHPDASLSPCPILTYGCGIYTLRKNN